MMTGVLVAAGLVGYGFAIFYALDAEDQTIRWGCRAVVFFGLAWAFQMGLENAQSGPCLSWETRMYYNAPTRTMRPVRVCTSRGEWIDED